jgi:hypothetical protein
MRKTAVSPSTICEVFQLIAASDRVLSNASAAAKQILSDLGATVPDDRSARTLSDGSGELTPISGDG